MKFTAEEISGFLNGEIIGDPCVTVTSISKIEDGKKGSLTFLYNPKYETFLYTTEASIVLVNKDFIPRQQIETTLIKVADSYQAFASLLELYTKTRLKSKSGIEQPSFMDETAQLGEEVYFGAFAYAGKNVRIGNRVKIYPHVYIGDNSEIEEDTVIFSGARIYEGTRIGARCIIHSGAVIGSDGFGFAPTENGTYRKIPQVGSVLLEDDVEIGANTVIDCGTIGQTVIHKGVKLDNLIQIAHNCEVGENTVMAAQSGVAGSSKIGKNCRFGGQVGIVGHLTVGDNVQIGAQSGISKNIKPNETILATPAMEYKQAIKMYSIMRNLPQLRQEIIDIQKEISFLKEKIK